MYIYTQVAQQEMLHSGVQEWLRMHLCESNLYKFSGGAGPLTSLDILGSLALLYRLFHPLLFISFPPL